MNYEKIKTTTKTVYEGTKQVSIGTYRFLTNRYVMVAVGAMITSIVAITFFQNYRLRTPIIVSLQLPIEARKIDYINPRGGIVAGATKTYEPVEIEEGSEIEVLSTFIGTASYYSKDGCLGCNANQIMANGEKFQEGDFTLAMNHLPLNTLVRVTNTDNDIRVVARVTDTGCFNQKGRDMNAKNGVICTNNLDRIADLSKALAEAIELKTDVSIIKIEQLPVSTGE